MHKSNLLNWYSGACVLWCAFLTGALVLLCSGALCFAADETITLTTYYPAPYGVYDELRSNKMAIGKNAAMPTSQTATYTNPDTGETSTVTAQNGVLNIDYITDPGDVTVLFRLLRIGGDATIGQTTNYPSTVSIVARPAFIFSPIGLLTNASYVAIWGKSTNSTAVLGETQTTSAFVPTAPKAGVYGASGNLNVPNSGKVPGVYGFSLAEGTGVLGYSVKGNGVSGQTNYETATSLPFDPASPKAGVYGDGGGVPGVYGTISASNITMLNYDPYGGKPNAAVYGSGSSVCGVYGTSNGYASYNANIPVAGVMGEGISPASGVFGFNSDITLTFNPVTFCVAGVQGRGLNLPGVYGYSNQSTGVYGKSDAVFSNGTPFPQPIAGVYGEGQLSVGVYGKSTGSFAGYFEGKVAINTDSNIKVPSTATVDIGGGNGDLGVSEGDLRIGNATYRLKIGVDTVDPNAGDVRIRASGGTNNLILGSSTRDVVNVSGTVSSFGVFIGSPVADPVTVLTVTGLTGSSDATYKYLRYNSAKGAIYYDTSSIKYKENVSDFKDNFSNILKITPKSYIDKESKAKEFGYIAEDFDQLGLKNLVIYDQEGKPESLKYERIPVYLVEVAKAQQKEIEDLKAKLEKLEKKLSNK